MIYDIEELKEEIEHEATKVFHAHLATGVGWAAFVLSYFPPAPFDMAIGLPGLLAFVGGAVMSALYLFADGWRDEDGNRVTLHGRIRGLRKRLRRLEADKVA